MCTWLGESVEENRREKGIVFACHFLVSVLGSEPLRRVGRESTLDFEVLVREAEIQSCKPSLP